MRARLRKLGAIDNLERLTVLAPAHQIVRRGRRDDLEELYQEGRDLQRRTGGGRTHVWLRVTRCRAAQGGEGASGCAKGRRRVAGSARTTPCQARGGPPFFAGASRRLSAGLHGERGTAAHLADAFGRAGAGAAHRLAGGGGSAGSLKGAEQGSVLDACRRLLDKNPAHNIGQKKRRKTDDPR